MTEVFDLSPATLEVVVNGVILRFPFLRNQNAQDEAGKIIPHIGQRHAFKNGDRERVVMIASEEGVHHICVDDVQSVSIIDARMKTLLEASSREWVAATSRAGLNPHKTA